MSNELTPKDVVVRYVNAVAEGDLAVITDSFAEDATWTYPGDVPLTRVWSGRDAIINDFLGSGGVLFAPGGTPKVTLTNVIADGAQVVAEWRSEGVAKAGAIYDNLCLGVFTVRDGRIASVREYTDTQHVAKVLFPEA
ncbi:nuclear transport factor 2 family protein [Kitasatospora sp. NBC_01287]|uniref:nuclear transport factor 2 family protein n=1 Tax=Kitasatospora sp. NBC_01287 TaxID=2903573 RepID=UPI002250813C|nr:nuclear transport factor 2 family protein [Kitasatospora sp. NBC_01287]MCX4747921.1 nuclear transport factor 2 family protein [Kitasatospora sp. NBC_01287]